MATCGSRTASSVPGTTGTPLSFIFRRDASLSPITSMLAAVGPMNTRPAASTCRQKAAFSDRKPYPGWMAPAPVPSATSIRRDPTR